MIRQYLKETVYEAFQQRMHFIFKEFDHIFVSFSGGKDSGLLLNMALDFRSKYYPHKRIGVFHQDFEAQYSVTTEYVERTFQRLEKERMVDLYWFCLPMATRTCFSSYQMYWYPWDDTKEEIWVRPMPRHPYVINLKNNPMTTYRYRMHQEDLAKQFGRWYRTAHGGGKTVCLLGIRADESLQRYSGILNKKYGYQDRCWISKQFKAVSYTHLTMDKVHVVKGKLQGGAINMVGSDGMPNECDIVYIGGQVWQVYGDELGNLAPEKAPWWASMHTFTGAVAWQKEIDKYIPEQDMVYNRPKYHGQEVVKGALRYIYAEDGSCKYQPKSMADYDKDHGRN